MSIDEDSLKKEILNKKKDFAKKQVDFSNKIKEDLNLKKPGKVDYSNEYSIFKKEQLSKGTTIYEKFARICGKILPIKGSEKSEKEIDQYLRIIHLDLKPRDTLSASVVALLLSLFLSIGSFFLFGSFVITAILIGASLGVFFYLKSHPKRLYQIWKAKASDQFVLAVLYTVIYMKQDSNLERAMYFISKNLAPPLSLDFIKILWNFQAGTFSSVEESLEDYLKIWKGKADSFINSMHLITSSLRESNKERAEDLMKKAKETILQSVNDNMLHYAHNLQSPIKGIYLLGIVLPVLLLTLIPMVGAFMGDSIKSIYIFLFYNVVLAIVIWFMSKNVLLSRPSGISSTDPGLVKFEKRKSKFFYAFLGILIFAVFSIPFFISVLGAVFVGEELREFFLSNNASFYFSVLFVAGIGLSLSAYYWLSNHKPYVLKKKLNSIEDSFSSIIYQLGVKMDQNIPAEVAMVKIAEENPGTEAGEFFSLVYSNLSQKGMSLRESLFDKENGALISYPSATIRSVMSMFVESVKKSPKIASRSLLTVSHYLKDVKRVYERLKDLLADTLSSIKMQAQFMAPIIAGVVVSLSVLITRVLVQLGKQMNLISELSTSATTSAAPVDISSISFFNISSAMPSPIFQLIVGIYIIEIVFILSYLYSGVTYGFDKIEFKQFVSKNLLLSTILYCLIAIVGSFLLSQIASKITLVGA